MGNTPTATIEDKKISFVPLSKFPFSYSLSTRLKNLKLRKSWVFFLNSLFSAVDYTCKAFGGKTWIYWLQSFLNKFGYLSELGSGKSNYWELNNTFWNSSQHLIWCWNFLLLIWILFWNNILFILFCATRISNVVLLRYASFKKKHGGIFNKICDKFVTPVS